MNGKTALPRLALPVIGPGVAPPPPRRLTLDDYQAFVTAAVRLLPAAERERLREQARKQAPRVRFVLHPPEGKIPPLTEAQRSQRKHN